MNLCNMSKFDNLVEIAKESIEKEIIQEVGYSNNVFLPTNGEDLIGHLGSDWYFDILASAGYNIRTIERRVIGMDYDKLASALDEWYKTELYPKLYNTFQSKKDNSLSVIQ